MSFCVGLEATKRCNFKCRHCYVDAGRADPNEMDTAGMKAVIQGLADCRIGAIGWSGGEPLLRSDLEDLTAFGARRGLDFTLATNGYLASRPRLAELQKCGLSVIQVSLDGPTPAKASRFRSGPQDAFKRAVQAASDAVAVGLTVYLCSLLSPDTAADLEEMAAFTRELGVGSLRYTMWMPVGRATGSTYDEKAWGGPELYAFFERLPHIRQSGLDVVIDCPTGPHPRRWKFRCEAGYTCAYIRSNGDLYPCTALMQPEYLVGNVRDKPVPKVLFSGKVLKMQRQLAAFIPGGACTPCALRESCRGGCPGRTIAAFGSLSTGPHHGANPACLYRLHAGPG